MLFSCKNDNNQKEEQFINQEEKVTNTRKKIDIPNVTHYSKLNSAYPETEDYFGNFKLDRFNKEKSSLFLDGISDYGIVDYKKELNPTEQMTVSVWYKPDSYKGSGYNVIISKTSLDNKKQYVLSSVGNLYPKVPATFRFFISIGGKTYNLKTKPNFWEPNVWYLISGTYDGASIKLYVNNNLEASKKVTGKMDTYETDLFIGKSAEKKFYTSGHFDDLRIFNRAISKKEIEALYANK